MSSVHENLIAAKARRSPNSEATATYLEQMVAYEPNTGCWIWLGTVDQHGYGQLKINGKHVRAHRHSYRVFKEPISACRVVRHSCDQPGCINPDHLSLGTQAQNIADCIRKGRFPKGVMSSRSRISEGTVREVRHRASLSESHTSIGRALGMSREHVRDIVAGKIWKEVI